MSHTPIAVAEGLRIGTVEFISPDEVKAFLDVEAPDGIALNAGGVRPFPRVNGYVLMPLEDGYLVGQIEWLTIERSAFPKRRGVQDFGVVDLPYPLRKMSLVPLGILRKEPGPAEAYGFRRGAHALPSVGAGVLLPTERQLHSIVESGERRRVRIGSSPLANNAEVRVDPDRLFGRHLAVLGNTGSGKSCSAAGLIRWSMESARAASGERVPNARFIVLDPNGEYARAFGSGEGGLQARIIQVNPSPGKHTLKVPLWFWNSAEWCSFTQASTKTQRPTLIHALRAVREGHGDIVDDHRHQLRRFLRTLVTTIRHEQSSGAPWGTFPKPKSFFEKIEKWRFSLEQDLPKLEGDEKARLQIFVDGLQASRNARQGQHPQYDFSREEVDGLLAAARTAHAAMGGSEADLAPADVDAPIPFTADAFLRSIEATAEMLNLAEHTETLLVRTRSLLKDGRIAQIIGDTDTQLDVWLGEMLGAEDEADHTSVTIVDLSFVPTEVIHIVTSVIARMIFEALQRYRKLAGAALPTVLVMEEAHTFIKRYREEAENPDVAAVCCQVFERIAREGRKFGLGLVLSSQRPSELSPTVLSQCNTFLLHRISNDVDQDLVRRLVPDNLRGLLRELPSLPSQHGVLLGWAVELPTLVRMDDLPRAQQPQSDDPDFWDVWIGKDSHDQPVERPPRWKDLAKDWQLKKEAEATQPEAPPADPEA